MILKNAQVYYKGSFKQLDLEIKENKITKIETNLTGDNEIDLSNKHVFPGFIDVHVHLREPGYTNKETIKAGTIAAAKGGYTTVFSMPNVDPVPNTVENLQVQLDIINKDACINVYPYGAITEDLKDTNLTSISSLSKHTNVFTNDGFGVQSEEKMLQAMKDAKANDVMIVAHCEDDKYIVTDNERAEYAQVDRDIKLVEQTGAKYHVCHISTKESINFVKAGKAKGLPVTCEVTPHHLILDQSMINNNTNYKMNPPLRDISDVHACIEGIKTGVIDMIATDHAPHTEEEKSLEYSKAPNGIAYIEYAFPILYTNLVKNNTISLELLTDLMTTNPSKVFNLEEGIIDTNLPANLAIFDLNQKFTINKDDTASLGKNSPFDNIEVYAKHYMTIYNGDIIQKGDETNE